MVEESPKTEEPVVEEDITEDEAVEEEVTPPSISEMKNKVGSNASESIDSIKESGLNF